MNRRGNSALGMVVLLCSLSAFGQHGGHGGGGGRGGAPRGTGSTSDSSLQDFNHALAVQATPDQVSRFQSLAKSTEDARKQAQDLLRLAAKADDPNDFSYHVAALKDAVEVVQGDNKSFVKSFYKIAEIGIERTDEEAGQGGFRGHETKEGVGPAAGTSPGQRRRSCQHGGQAGKSTDRFSGTATKPGQGDGNSGPGVVIGKDRVVAGDLPAR